MEKSVINNDGRKVLLSNSIFFREVTEMLDSGMSVTIPVKGNSMFPFITGGRDRVVLKRKDVLKAGDIVLALIDGRHYVLHRIYDINGNNIRLMGDGNIDVFEKCKSENVCGTVVLIERNGRKVRVSSFYESIKVHTWKILLPLRKYLLAVFRYKNRCW